MRFKILGPDYIHELDDDFTVHGVNKFILSKKNNIATMLEHTLDAIMKVTNKIQLHRLIYYS